VIVGDRPMRWHTLWRGTECYIKTPTYSLFRKGQWKITARQEIGSTSKDIIMICRIVEANETVVPME